MRITYLSSHSHPSVRDWAVLDTLNLLGLRNTEQLNWLPGRGQSGLSQARWSSENLTVLLTRLEGKTVLDSVSCTANNEVGETELLALLGSLAAKNYHPLARKSVQVHAYRSDGQSFSQSKLHTDHCATNLEAFTWHQGNLCFMTTENRVAAPQAFPISWIDFKNAATFSAFWVNRPQINGIAYMVDNGTPISTFATELLEFMLGGHWRFGQNDRIPVPNMAGDGYIDEIIGEQYIIKTEVTEELYYRADLETLARITQHFVWESPIWLRHLRTLLLNSRKERRLITKSQSPAGDHILLILTEVEKMLQ